MVQGLKAAVYARVSSEEQVEGYSLDAQRRAFQALVEGRGWTVFQEYLEEGRSAHTDDIRKRLVFKQAIHYRAPTQTFEEGRNQVHHPEVRVAPERALT